jgi:hypothetical protein
VKLRHLSSRFFRALWPGPPSRVNRAWVETVLTPAELDLWRRMPNHDQRHSIAVARRVERTLAGTDHAGERCWLAAALLHDVGKLDAGLSVPGRVMATGVVAVQGRETVAARAGEPGLSGRIARYSQHPARGAVLIEQIGGSPEAARWAAAHHDSAPPAGIPVPVVAALRAADDD